MDVVPPIASIGALIGSPARANILTILFDGRALTATELSEAASVAPATASDTLASLSQPDCLFAKSTVGIGIIALPGVMSPKRSNRFFTLYRIVPCRYGPLHQRHRRCAKHAYAMITSQAG